MVISVVFPGQGSQYIGMGKELYENFEYVKEVFREASEVLKKDIAQLCFLGPEEHLRLTENSQPTIFTVSMASYEVLRKELGINPTVGAGHSLGEYTALVCSGVLKFAEAISVLAKRGTFMQEAVPAGRGSMAAIIGLSIDEVDGILQEVDGIAEIANINGAGQIVISGERKPVQETAEKAKARGAKRAIELSVSAPFHCSLMKPAAERLRPYLDELSVGDFSFPVVANLTGNRYPGASEVPPYLEKQIYSPVKWEETIRCMGKNSDGILIEAGSGKVLSGLARRMLPGWKIASFGTAEELKKVEEILK